MKQPISKVDPTELTETDRVVLSLIDGRLTLGEIAAGSGLDWEDAYAALGHLVELGIAELATAQSEASPLSAQSDDGSPDELGAISRDAANAGESPSPDDLRQIIEYLRNASGARP